MAGDLVLGSFGSGIGQGAVESASGVAGKPAASLTAWSLTVHWQYRLRPDTGLRWAGTASPARPAHVIIARRRAG